MRNYTLLFVLTLIFCAHAFADDVAGRVVLPDGKPAVGAKIIARQFYSRVGGISVKELTTETDNMGIFRLDVPLIEYTASNRGRRPYLLIDAPACALCIMMMSAKVVGAPYEEIKLQRDFPIAGTVVDSQKKPLKGAQIEVAACGFNMMEGALLNRDAYLSTPQLISTTDAKGNFQLRGITLRNTTENDLLDLVEASVQIKATANIEGKKLQHDASLRLHMKGGKSIVPKPFNITLVSKA